MEDAPEDNVDSVAEAETEAEKILSEAAEQSEKILAEAFKRSQEAEEKFKEADFQTKMLIQETQNECDQILAEVRGRAEEEAKETLEQARQEGHKQGYDEGYAEGVNQGRIDGENAVRDEMKDTIYQANAKAEKTIQDAKEQTAEYFIKAEDDVVKVVMMAIERIIPQHFLDVPQIILPVVRDAIKHVRDQKEIKVHVEPDSYDLILMARSEFQSMLTDGAAILEIVSDETLRPGDCLIETPNGGVDARLSTQIEMMKDAVKKVLNKG
jgi:flagellar assembly protein FliH